MEDEVLTSNSIFCSAKRTTTSLLRVAGLPVLTGAAETLLPVVLVVGRALVAADGDPETVDNLFLASATAPPLLVGFDIGTVRLAVEETGLTAAFGLEEVTETAAFRAVVDEIDPRFSARVSVLAVFAPEVDGAREVLLAAAAASGFFFSSPEPPVDGVARWLALEDVGAVAVLAGLRTVDPVAGLVGGLLNPPVVLADGIYSFGQSVDSSIFSVHCSQVA